jgi:predicted dehydrogenase
MSLTIFHLPIITALPKLFTLHSVMERSGKATCKSIIEDHVKVVETIGEVAEDEEVEVVIVASSNNSHMALVKRCLEAGKHGEFSFPGFWWGLVSEVYGRS